MAKQTPTGFGVLLRKHRLDRGETLYVMANTVGVSSSFLSAVETGQKPAPDDLVNKLIAHLRLDWIDAADLRDAVLATGPELRIPLKGKDKNAREIAAMFARRFADGDLDALRHALAGLERKKEI